MQIVEITPDNYKQARALSVSAEQIDFVAPVEASLADAFVYKGAQFRLAQHDEQIIGYTLVYPFEGDGQQIVNIIRLMIDQQWQGQGFGRKLLQAVLTWVLTFDPAPDLIRISVVPENTIALTLYKSVGFVEHGMEHGELVLQLDPATITQQQEK